MKARDIMTSPVVTVGTDASVSEIAALLFEHRISAVPVLADGRLVGIVSEADLLHRHEIGTDFLPGAGPWWMRLFSAEPSVADYIKSHARRAQDVMTRDVATVAPDTPLAEVADVLHKRGVKRVPVMRGERLVGIVSRSNLVQALATHRAAETSGRNRTDEAIRRQLLDELRQHSWWRESTSNVSVTAGVVVYSGTVDSPEERDAARVAAENVPGVRRIEDNRRVFRDLPSIV